MIRIGTRDSELAIWQGKEVQKQLAILNVKSELVFIKSDGDIHLTQPLYELGVQGIFTKALDAALLNHEIDIAVHSYKDVPTSLAKNTVIAAVLERNTWQDVFISKEPMEELVKNKNLIIATGSTRRKAQWLHKYPEHQIENIRGNINSRVKKLLDNKNWNGTILSKAGVERINLQAPYIQDLDWMLSAPAQGAVVVTSRKDDADILEACRNFNHQETEICTGIEKEFLRNLMGGCSSPIGALAVFEGEKIFFRGNVLSIDGFKKAEVELYFDKNDFEQAGKVAAEKIRENGGEEILKELKKSNRKYELTKLTKILVTKKLNQQWVDKAAQKNLVLYPTQFLKLEYIPMQPFSIWKSSAFIFTSANGVEGFNRCLVDFGIEWNADRIYFSTSGATKLALVEKACPDDPFGRGLGKLYTSKNSEGLANLIQEYNNQNPGLTYFYFTCKQRLNTLETILTESNINLDIIEVYSKEIIPAKIDFFYDTIIFYSPSQVEAFLINNQLNPETPVFCIGDTTGKMARKKGFKHVNISDEPTTGSLIDLIVSQK